MERLEGGFVAHVLCSKLTPNLPVVHLCEFSRPLLGQIPQEYPHHKIIIINKNVALSFSDVSI